MTKGLRVLSLGAGGTAHLLTGYYLLGSGYRLLLATRSTCQRLLRWRVFFTGQDSQEGTRTPRVLGQVPGQVFDFSHFVCAPASLPLPGPLSGLCQCCYRCNAAGNGDCNGKAIAVPAAAL